MSDDKEEIHKYVDGLRKRAEDAKADANLRLLTIGNLTRERDSLKANRPMLPSRDALITVNDLACILPIASGVPSRPIHKRSEVMHYRNYQQAAQLIKKEQTKGHDMTQTINLMIHFFSQDNPAFNPDRFLKAINQ